MQALLHLKYRPDRQLASIMAGWMEQVYLREGWKVTLIVPVPLSTQRVRQRGFNQAYLLAEALGNRLGVPTDAERLRRIADTRSQVGLDPSERWVNVSHAFGAAPGSFEGDNVLLVDDLMTTGATLSSCALAMKDAGARSVWGLTVARA